MLPNPPHDDRETLPPLYHDRSFWGMTVTQFLGAFNDSVFKQIVLLLCVTVVVSSEGELEDKQFLAQALFAIPFILFSGLSGFWSDRIRKRSIIVACKIGEIAVMLMAAIAFAVMASPSLVASTANESTLAIVGVPWLLFGVLFLMGAQSALFGPAKYGILPEMVRSEDLPRMNGMIQMTTFLALILGAWVGGILLDEFDQALWKAGAVCVGIAVIGTLTSLAVRRTPIAQPKAPFHWTSLAIAPETWALLRQDIALRRALWVYSIFWFVAAIFPMAVNWLGKVQYGLNSEATSFMLATVSIGIATGFLVAGRISAGGVRFGLVRIGAFGLVGTMILLSLPATLPDPNAIDAVPPEPLLGRWGCQAVLVFSGFFAGLFALPVQVFLQSRPPEPMKGRVIGTMNLINWIAIIAAAMFFAFSDSILEQFAYPKFGIFGLTGLLLLPIAIFYHPRDAEL